MSIGPEASEEPGTGKGSLAFCVMSRAIYTYRILRKRSTPLSTVFGLTDKAIFQTEVSSMTWGEEQKEWCIDLVQKPKDREERAFTTRSQFAMMCPGALVCPKVSNVPGIADVKGVLFHASRWNYEITGSSPSDWNLGKLRDKMVGIVVTAATCIQVLPPLATSAKQVYVVPCAPADRGTGWQIAARLKAWHPSWCKRPLFHDDNLPCFNRADVALVDTDGRGVQGVSADGVLVPGPGPDDTKTEVHVTGGDGADLGAKSAAGLTTLHGVASADFPNMFF
ncbi:hypothetical protein F4780DRAFT_787227 [Xylariomycetidae sp. FL0641]|nr:hypothetical protein F4780DRAFT_787227 [Xylariomycetidae sp. FL0641]